MNKRYTSLKEIENDFPIRLDHQVVWGDMDAYQHVNNVVYFRYFESSRSKLFLDSGIDGLYKESGIGPILAKTDCKYIRPVMFPDQLTTFARIQKDSITKDSFVLDHLVWSEASGAPAALGTSSVVFFDYRAQARADIPISMLDTVKSYSG